MDENEKKLNNSNNKNDDFDIDSQLDDFLNESLKASEALNSIVGEDKSENVVASADVTLTNLEIRKLAAKVNESDNKIHNDKDESLENVSKKISKEDIISSESDDLSLSVDDILSDINPDDKNTEIESENEIEKSDVSEVIAQPDNNIDKPYSINSSKGKFNINIDYSKSDTLDSKISHKLVNNKKNLSDKKRKNKKVKVNNSIFTGLIVTIIVLVVSVSLAFFGISIGLEYLGINKSDSVIKLNIKEGSNTNDIAQQLEDAGIIDNQFLFKVIVNLKNAGSSMKPGDIELKPSSSYADKIDALMQQRQSFKTVSVVFPEGIDLLGAAKLLEQKGVISDYQELIYTFNHEKFGYDFESIIDNQGNKFYSMEGYFYPDTYDFYLDDSSYNVVKKVREHFNSKITSSMKEAMQKSGMSMDQVITLASIVQAEAGSVKDMPKVASVFLNRMNDSANFPRLESDATGNYYNDVIKIEAKNSKAYTESETKAFKDLYDTYVANGLLAGPICNPGIDAINAVLNPEKTDYLYFCSNLKTKKTYFAKTLANHKKNLKKAGLTD